MSPAGVAGELRQHASARPSQRPPDLGEIRVIRRGGRSQGDGAGDQLDGLLGLAELIGSDAQQVQGVGVRGLARQNGLIEPGGVEETPSLVVLEGGLHRVLHRQGLLRVGSLVEPYLQTGGHVADGRDRPAGWARPAASGVQLLMEVFLIVRLPPVTYRPAPDAEPGLPAAVPAGPPEEAKPVG